MANITKRTNKRLARHLGTSAVVRVAVLAEPKGTYGPAMIPGVLFARTTMNALERRAHRDREFPGGLAAQLPGGSMVIAVVDEPETDARVVFAPSNGLSFKAPVLSCGVDELSISARSGARAAHRLTLVFADSSAAEVDAQRLQPIDELIGALTGPEITFM